MIRNRRNLRNGETAIFNAAAQQSPNGKTPGNGMPPGYDSGANKGDQLGMASDAQSVAINGVQRPQIAGDSPSNTGVRGVSGFTVEADNTGSATDEVFFLGSRQAIALAGLTASVTDLTKTPTELEAFLASFNYAPMSIDMLVVRASSDPAQLQEEILVYSGVDINKANKGVGAVQAGLLGNPTFENDLLLRIAFENPDDQPALNWNQFLLFPVLAGEKLSITVRPSVAWNRQR